MAKRNSNDAAPAESTAESTAVSNHSDADLTLEPLPRPTLRQKVALGVMVLLMLGWLAFLLALAVKK